jgi:hypothetical protein
MDLSKRPWDNGYTAPQEAGDMFEAHPYHFFGSFRPRSLATANPQAGDGKHAVVINEYGWHWVNRDGTPTTLTRELYGNVLGANATPAQRFHMQATWLAADTEFWRAHRKAAAVMHFTTLGYSRPDGQTCDHWTKGGVAKLQWEPEFHRYVRDAFAPVGLMVDYWKDRSVHGAKAHVPVVVINDLDQAWRGPVTLRLERGGQTLFEAKQECRLNPLGRAKIGFDIAWPEEVGPCVLEAELSGADGEAVHSVREMEIVDAESISLAYKKPVTASSTHSAQYKPENAVDDDSSTYWSSTFQDGAWLAVDLGAAKKISRVSIEWQTAFAKSFLLQVSTDGKNWTNVYKTDNGKGGISEIKFAPVEARHVRLVCTKRGTQWGNAVCEMGVFQK